MINSTELDIEIAFTGFLFTELQGFENLPDNFLFNTSNFWREQLIVWIEYIRNTFQSNCPQVVIEQNSLSIGLQLTDDESITQLNKKWRQKPIKTDVLAFPALDQDIVFPGSPIIELGDIIVSVPTAKSQALEHKHSLDFELRWLVSHGLLHLLGWDHPDSNSLNQMLSLQEQLLAISVNLSSAGI
tara:strand:- start:16 stop:573 length:558 start_codon:yes stop_codon:yes gene_type:complete